ncbi:CHAD domain-containing protein [Nocardia sp. CDC159]|uniref:CHAD domain-containing protein n=1 Tax=Nocardia pulmonis TaxID=2951408 RepID=A0A9X2E3H6_9NOCA|nr:MULTISPECIES: CHAD domain-containing protein [Nocardia]MCM6773462.1 CHAD domain-containing protein [Nocardia pulmonis]MCM6786349.1 CHAD domain-containing protein [Nocardia sp. CDC159]
MRTAAGPALVTALADDLDRLLSAEPDVRADRPDSVHSMRVATRRLRSVLRSYQKMFHRTEIDEIRDELRWLAGLLGVARDAEVRAERFAALTEEQPAELRRIGRRLVSAERAKYTRAHRAVLRALDGDRYAALRDRLERLRSDPPLRKRRAKAEAADAFATVLRKDFRRLRKLVRAESEVAETDRVEHLHEIRKAAKRLRYSADAAARVLDGPAQELSQRSKKLQSVLGDHRDAVEAMATIQSRADAARKRGAATGVYDELYVSEASAARKALENYPVAAEFLQRKFADS